jgi:hypothetical protein
VREFRARAKIAAGPFGDPSWHPVEMIDEGVPRSARAPCAPARALGDDARHARVLPGRVGRLRGYDTVRFAEPEKLGFVDRAARTIAGCPTCHFGFYDGVVVFDHVDKVVQVVVRSPGGSRAPPG